MAMRGGSYANAFRVAAAQKKLQRDRGLLRRYVSQIKRVTLKYSSSRTNFFSCGHAPLLRFCARRVCLRWLLDMNGRAVKKWWERAREHTRTSYEKPKRHVTRQPCNYAPNESRFMAAFVLLAVKLKLPINYWLTRAAQRVCVWIV